MNLDRFPNGMSETKIGTILEVNRDANELKNERITTRDLDGRPLREGDYQPGSTEDQMRTTRDSQSSHDNSSDGRGSDDESVAIGGDLRTSMKKVKSKINTGLANTEDS